MATQRVRSTAIGFVDYDFEKQVLTVTFSDGSRYSYQGVPNYVYAGMLVAPSVGKYFNAAIRNSYAFSRA